MTAKDQAEERTRLRRVISRATAEARVAGLGHATGAMQAVKAVMDLQPDLSEREAVIS